MLNENVFITIRRIFEPHQITQELLKHTLQYTVTIPQ